MKSEDLSMPAELARLDLLRDTDEIAELAQQPANEREMAILQRDGRSIGILLPTEDPKLLEQILSYIEDLLDAEEARAVAEDPTEEWKPLVQVRAELGL